MTIDELLTALSPRLRRAFLQAILVMRDGINMPELRAALQAGDIERAVTALNIDPAIFTQYVLERGSTYAQAGEWMSTVLMKSVPKYMPVPTFRFDMTNPRAESKIRTDATARVVGYTQEQQEIARRVIADGFARGEGPITIATDIAGRINPVSKRREGGIIGLSDPQAQYVENMKKRLLSGDPDEMLKVIGTFKNGKWQEGTGMTLRDRRFDGIIRKAIRDGKPVPATKVAEMTAKYADRLLKRRAEDIARTETAMGVELARAEAVKQALEKSGLPDDAVTKTWVHQGGIRHARNTHLVMHGKQVGGLEGQFILPDGSVMLYPHDPAGGVRNNANCRCRSDIDVDWGYGL